MDGSKMQAPRLVASWQRRGDKKWSALLRAAHHKASAALPTEASGLQGLPLELLFAVLEWLVLPTAAPGASSAPAAVAVNAVASLRLVCCRLFVAVEASGAFHDALMREVEAKLEMVVTEAELATLAKEKKRELRRQQRKAENERKRRLKQAASQAAAEAEAAANAKPGYEVPEEKRRRANRRRANRRTTKGTAHERPREQVVDEADVALRQSRRKAALEEAQDEEKEEGSSLGWQPTPARLQFVSRALRTALGMGGRRPLRQQSYYINRYVSCSVTARVVTLPSALFLLTERHWDEVVKAAFSAEAITWSSHQDEPCEHLQIRGRPAVVMEADEWSGQHSLRLGALTHLPTLHDLDAALENFHIARFPAPGSSTKSDPMVRRASVDELLGLFGRSLLMVTPFMVWHDLEFETAPPEPVSRAQPRRRPSFSLHQRTDRSGQRFFLLGPRAACVVQVKYHHTLHQHS